MMIWLCSLETTWWLNYAKEMCVAWDLKREKHMPSKARQKEEMQTIISYHESHMIHGR
jgi:hypothetical protein